MLKSHFYCFGFGVEQLGRGARIADELVPIGRNRGIIQSLFRALALCLGGVELEQVDVILVNGRQDHQEKSFGGIRKIKIRVFD